MAKDRLSGKLAVILHADIVGSTALVHQDEQLAHQRIQDTFRRFGDTVSKYYGQVRELKPQGTSHTFVSARHGKQSDNVIWF